MIAFRGRHARQAHVELVIESENVIKCLTEHAGIVSLHITYVYKHMGGALDVNNSMMCEIGARGASANGALMPL